MTNNGVQIDASQLSNELLEQSVASGVNVAGIDGRLSVVEGNVSTLLNQATVSPTAFSSLLSRVDALPTVDDVSGRLSLLGGTMQGALTMKQDS